MRRILGAWPRKTAFALLIAAWSGSAPSEVTLDGSLGGARGPLPGPDFEIGTDFGRQVGRNLFHSFGAFNLDASESATFSGPNVIKNILGRVTGGSGSHIDGWLRSTVPDANLFLLNPAGIVFGPSATLDVQGSFHASTGDFIRLGDGRQFDAVPSANDALLTTAPPQAFGFLGRQDPAPIEVNGSFLQVRDGKDLSLIGGDIRVHSEGFFGAGLIAPAGRVNLASVGAKAEVTLGPDDLGVEPRSRGGTVTLSDGSLIDTSGEGGGSAFIRGGKFVMDSSEGVFVRDGEFVIDSSEVRSQTFGDKDGGVVSIDAERVELENRARIDTTTRGSGRGGGILVDAGNVLLSGSTILTSTVVAEGAAGDVEVRARDLFQMDDATFIVTAAFGGSGPAGAVLLDAGEVLVSSGSGIFADSFRGSGDGGNVTVTARDLLQMRDRAFISTTVSFGTGRGGDVRLEAKHVSLGEKSRIFTSTLGEGQAGGNVTVAARDLFELRDGSFITASAFGPGRGGRIQVSGGDVIISGEGSSIESRSTRREAGPAGNIDIDVQNKLEVVDGATIDSTTVGDRNAGAIDINARTITLARRGSIESKSGELDPDLGLLAGHGDAGRVSIDAERLEITEGGSITTTTRGPGRGGAVDVEADEIVLEGRDAGLFARSEGTAPGSGGGGALTVNAGSVMIKEGATISASTFGPGSGGKLSITAADLDLRDGASITSESRSGGSDAGDAGSVTVKARDLRVRDGAQITTSTLGDGNAGPIDVKADTIKLVNRGKIASASGSEPDAGKLVVGTGDAGRVSIDAERLEITEGGSITTTTRGPGRGGAVDVEADEIVLEGRDAGLFARAEGTAPGSGGGGALTVNAGSLMIKEGATISAGTFGPGSGGKLSITAVDLELRDGASITSESISDSPDAGQSGEIFIRAADSFRLFNDSQVSVKTNRADAGNIDLDVGFLLHLRDSSITTSVADGEGDGGNINIDPVFVVLDNSEIIAGAFRGRGGNIHIVADHFFASPDSEVRASSALGIDGVVEIDSPDTDLNAGLVELPADFFDAATLLTQGCAPGADVSRLVVRKYEVLPDSPAALRVPPPGGPLRTDAQDGGFAFTRETLGPSFEHSSGCDGDG
ncbi:MAG: filamentous hemagglutinin N-terminal domain-containing protein [Chromatiales bacterium]